jgi:hypothetical protein
MKKIASILFALILLVSCKKENTEVTSSKYDLSFTITMSVPGLAIAYNKSDGDVDSMIVNSDGVNYSYGSVKKGTELILAGQSLKIDSFGFAIIVWKDKEVVQKVDSFWLGGGNSAFETRFTY